METISETPSNRIVHAMNGRYVKNEVHFYQCLFLAHLHKISNVNILMPYGLATKGEIARLDQSEPSPLFWFQFYTHLTFGLNYFNISA